jgi:transcription initiation factor TFIID TATA-box-binding protein
MSNTDSKKEAGHKKAPKISLKPDFKIENIVASADLGVELDLYAIAKASPDVDYEPEQFPGAIYKIHNPKTALLLFKNGKVICTGSKTEADIHRAIDIMIKTVQKYILVPQNDEDEKK